MVQYMRFFATLASALALAGLTSCSVAEGLAKTLGRTGNSLSRSVSNIGNAVSNR